MEYLYISYPLIGFLYVIFISSNKSTIFKIFKFDLKGRKAGQRENEQASKRERPFTQWLTPHRLGLNQAEVTDLEFYLGLPHGW